MCGLFQSIHHLGERSDLRCRFQSILADLLKACDQFRISYAPTLKSIGVDCFAGIYHQSVHHCCGSQPILTQGFPEVLGRDFGPFLPIFLYFAFAVLRDVVMILLVGLAELFLQIALSGSHLDEGILQPLGRHVGVLNALPVDRGHLADAHCLADVVHSHTGLSRALTGVSRRISNTLHGLDRIVKFHTVIGELAKIAGHIAEVVDGLIRVISQFLKMRLDDFNGFAGGAHDRLHRIHLCLILRPSGRYRLYCQASEGAFNSIYNSMSQVKPDNTVKITVFEHLNSSCRLVNRPDVEDLLKHTAHAVQIRLDLFQTLCGLIEVQGFPDFLKYLETLGRLLHVKSVFKLSERIDRGLRILFEVLVIKVHCYDPLFHITIHWTTSFQTSFAICSKIGLMAGLI